MNEENQYIAYYNICKCIVYTIYSNIVSMFSLAYDSELECNSLRIIN